MKHFIISLAIVLLSANLHAQNWSPLLTNEKMNYQHSDSAYISHTIWVDDYNLSGPDTTFFLNRIVKDHPTNIDKALRNQAQFIFKAMNKLNDGIYHFTDPGYYIIKTWASVGDSWLFDPDNNLQATVSGKSQDEILGVIDSVKTISLSDGSEIKLSKSFGIIQFPDFENGGFYEMVGIQDSEYGESIPDFWDIYDFEVGDVFQYNREFQYIYIWHNVTEKVTITSKVVTSNSISYTINGISYAYSNNGPPASSIYNDELIFTYSDNHPANMFPSQIYLFPDSAMGNPETIFSDAKVVLNTETGLVHKHIGNNEENYTPFETNLFYEQSPDNDTLLRLEYASLVGEPCGLMGIGFGETIGDLYRTEGCFEYWDLKNLVGYIKDGDTVGTITPDSVLLVGISDKKSLEDKIKIYPNPASDILNISQQKEEEAFFELRNTHGQVVMSVNIDNKDVKINVNDVAPGIYFYLILQENKELITGKILIK